MIKSEPAIRFQKKGENDFYTTLKNRVEDYFQSKNLKKTGNFHLYFKTVCMFGFYFTPFFLIILGGFSPWAMLGLAILMGIGKAGIGFSVQHDANHGAYSSKRWVNYVLGYCINLIGGSSFVWKIQHNILHHTYTNIFEADEDIDAPFVLRLSPKANWRFFHRLQAIYAPFFYGLITLTWVAYADFHQLFRYFLRRETKVKKRTFAFELMILTTTKAFYFFYILVLPLLILDIAWWQVLIGFFSLHLTTGIILSIIFQLAHVVENTEQPVPKDDGKIENTWAMHQMHTTANFCKNNRVLSWFVGGLNFQIEHHLFSNISHIHYKSLSAIVKQTADDFNIPYLYFPSFWGAIKSHFTVLNLLGKNLPLPDPQRA